MNIDQQIAQAREREAAWQRKETERQIGAFTRLFQQTFGVEAAGELGLICGPMIVSDDDSPVTMPVQGVVQTDYGTATILVFGDAWVVHCAQAVRTLASVRPCDDAAQQARQYDRLLVAIGDVLNPLPTTL